MSAKKISSLARLTFGELKDKVKELEGLKSMNRFEITEAARQAEKLPELAAKNPRAIKPEIKEMKAKLMETKGDKKARHELRRTLAKLKRDSRKYLA